MAARQQHTKTQIESNNRGKHLDRHEQSGTHGFKAREKTVRRERRAWKISMALPSGVWTLVAPLP